MTTTEELLTFWIAMGTVFAFGASWDVLRKVWRVYVLNKPFVERAKEDRRKHQISCQDGWCRLEGSESNRRKAQRRVK